MNARHLVLIYVHCVYIWWGVSALTNPLPLPLPYVPDASLTQASRKPHATERGKDGLPPPHHHHHWYRSVAMEEETVMSTATIGYVYRSDIIKNEEKLTNRNIHDYSKAEVVWEKRRESVGSRQWVHYTSSICKREAYVPVTELNSPFCVPDSRSKDSLVVSTVVSLNERYMFVWAVTTDDEVKKIKQNIDWACVGRMPVTALSVAVLMLGTNAMVEDVTTLSSLISEESYSLLEWKAIPSAELCFDVPVVAGKLSPRACVCVERFGRYVLQHISKVQIALYDIEFQSAEVEEHEELVSVRESSSGWEGVSSDATSRRWSGGADLSRDVRVSIAPQNEQTQTEVTMRVKLETMLSPLMFTTFRRLRMFEGSWLVVVYFFVAAVAVGLLSFALPNFNGMDGVHIYFGNFGPSLFSYGFTWLTIPKAADVWYDIYVMLTEYRRKKITDLWQKRCIIAIVYGSFISFVSASMRTRRMINSYPDMILNVWAFIGITFALWMLNLVQICLVSYGITGYMFTCRMSKYDIQESKVTERTFSRFANRCAKMHRFRVFTFSSIFFLTSVCVAFLILVYQSAVRMKFFVFLPYGVILPHLDYNSDKVGPVVYLLLSIAPYVVIFLRTLYASLWAAKAKANRQVQLSGNVKDRFTESPSIAGWCLFYMLVRHQIDNYALLTRNAGC